MIDKNITQISSDKNDKRIKQRSLIQWPGETNYEDEDLLSSEETEILPSTEVHTGNTKSSASVAQVYSYEEEQYAISASEEMTTLSAKKTTVLTTKKEATTTPMPGMQLTLKTMKTIKETISGAQYDSTTTKIVQTTTSKANMPITKVDENVSVTPPFSEKWIVSTAENKAASKEQKVTPLVDAKLAISTALKNRIKTSILSVQTTIAVTTASTLRSTVPSRTTNTGKTYRGTAKVSVVSDSETITTTRPTIRIATTIIVDDILGKTTLQPKNDQTTPSPKTEKTTPPPGKDQILVPSGNDQTTLAPGNDHTTLPPGNEQTTPSSHNDQTTLSLVNAQTTLAADQNLLTLDSTTKSSVNSDLIETPVANNFTTEIPLTANLSKVSPFIVYSNTHPAKNAKITSDRDADQTKPDSMKNEAESLHSRERTTMPSTENKTKMSPINATPEKPMQEIQSNASIDIQKELYGSTTDADNEPQEYDFVLLFNPDEKVRFDDEVEANPKNKDVENSPDATVPSDTLTPKFDPAVLKEMKKKFEENKKQNTKTLNSNNSTSNSSEGVQINSKPEDTNGSWEGIYLKYNVKTEPKNSSASYFHQETYSTKTGNFAEDIEIDKAYILMQKINNNNNNVDKNKETEKL